MRGEAQWQPLVSVAFLLRGRAIMIVGAFFILLASCGSKPTAVCTNPQRQSSPMTTRRTDQEWAEMSGLSPGEVRRLRRLADVPDGSTDLYIANLDATNLASRRHILVVNSDSANRCRAPFVFERNGQDFRLVLPEKLPHETYYCYETRSEPPSIWATPDGKILVEIPFMRCSEACNGCVADSRIYRYEWNGVTYQNFEGERYASDR
jgi:hypothetical protein